MIHNYDDDYGIRRGDDSKGSVRALTTVLVRKCTKFLYCAGQAAQGMKSIRRKRTPTIAATADNSRTISLPCPRKLDQEKIM